MENATSGLIIDWRLLLLQASNFLLLLAVLSWLLWKPLIRLIDERRRTLAEGLAASEAQTKALAEFQVERQKLLAQAQLEARDLLAQTRAAVKAEQAALKAELKEERQRSADRNERDLVALKDRTLSEARSQLANLVVLAAGKLVSEPSLQSNFTKIAAEQALKELS